MSKEAFIADMEQRFGSNTAIGVRFRPENGKSLSLADYNALYDALWPDDPPAGDLVLPGGGYADSSKDCAAFVYKHLPGRVQIYRVTRDPSRAGETLPATAKPGYQFAFVDNRYLVDPMPRLAQGESQQLVYDLESVEDTAAVENLYGRRSQWALAQPVELLDQA